MRDDSSLVACKGNQSRRSTPVSIDNNDSHLQRDRAQKQSSTANTNQPPAMAKSLRTCFRCDPCRQQGLREGRKKLKKFKKPQEA